jgi:hypothetical protein
MFSYWRGWGVWMIVKVNILLIALLCAEHTSIPKRLNHLI